MNKVLSILTALGASALPSLEAAAYATVRLERKIDPRYQLIPLRVMHKLAIEAGAPLRAIPNEPQYQVPEELRSIAEKLLARQRLTIEEEALLARKYLHQSAHWNFGATANYLQQAPGALELLYANRPDPSGRRVILDNQ